MRKPVDDVHVVNFSLMLTLAQRDYVGDQSRARSITMSEYVRQLIDADAQQQSGNRRSANES